MSIRDEGVSFSLEVNVEKAYTTLRKLQTVVYRTLGLLRRLGLPGPLDEGIAKMQRAIAVANQLRLTMIALQAASGPLGWALAGIGLATTVFDVSDFMMDL